MVAVSSGSDLTDWPQWRGPGRDCRVSEQVWPSRLSQETLTQKVRVSLGESYSGPVVVADRVFVTESVGKNEVVRALDRGTGAEIWKKQWSGTMTVPFFAAANGSWIRSTPAWADGRLFVASMEDVLVCLNADDGAEIWTKDFRKEFGTKNQSFGFVCSPLVDGGSVYVQTAAGLVKLACDSGEVVWRSMSEGGGMMGGAFSSPVIATVAGRRQLVVQTRQELTGVALEDGSRLWSVSIPSFRGMNILTPTVVGDRIFTSSYGGGAFMIQVAAEGDSFSASELWKTKTEAYMSSPVVVGEQIYLHLRNQRVVCIDVRSGDVLWTTRPFGKYWSMVSNGSRALALDERGDLLLLDLNAKEFVMIDRLPVSEGPSWAHLAVSGNQIFVRDLEGLTIFEWENSEASGQKR